MTAPHIIDPSGLLGDALSEGHTTSRDGTQRPVGSARGAEAEGEGARTIGRRRWCERESVDDISPGGL